MVIALLGFVGTSLEGHVLSRFMSAVTVSAVRNVANNKQGALSPCGVTRLFYPGVMKRALPYNLSYSLESVLRCPRRFYLERVRRERVVAPFASSYFGKRVHQRIATSLRTNLPADTSAFRLPRRLLLQGGETLDDLAWRAQNALTLFNLKCRLWLRDKEIKHVEHYLLQPYRSGDVDIKVSGILDLILTSRKGDTLIDWKTGSAHESEDQLKFYLMLRYLETGREPRHAEAISLSTGEPLCVEWSEAIPRWFEGRLLEMSRRVERCQDDAEVAEAGRHCTYCPYAHACDQSEAPGGCVLDTFTGEVQGLGGAAYGRIET